MMRVSAAVLLLALAGACVETGEASDFEANVREATRQALGDAIKDAAFTVSDVQAAPMKVTWRVKAASGEFDCDADNKLALPSCRPVAS